jgi:hypothetical protein
MSLAGQEIDRVLWNLKIYHRTYNLQYFIINPICLKPA